MHFKLKRMIPLPYERQGYIFFICKNWRNLPAAQQKKILQTAQDACRQYAEPVMQFVTGDEGATAICRKYFISETTLYRAVTRFYLEFPRWI